MAAMPRLRNRPQPSSRDLAVRRSRPSASEEVPTETALLWGLIGDLLLAPLWLGGLVMGDKRARPEDGLRPLLRLQQFATAARMTALLISLNLLVFAVEVYLRHSGMSEAQLLRRLALRREELLAGHLTTLVTHAFAHAGFAHLCGNLLALFVFGRVVERHLGSLRLLGAYVVAALTAALVSLTAQYLAPGHPSVPMLGASGAVAGLVALGVLLEPFVITFEALVPLPLFALGWLTMAADLLALWRGAADHIDHPAHLGGYLSVSLYYFTLDTRQRHRARVGLLLNFMTALLALTLWHVVG